MRRSDARRAKTGFWWIQAMIAVVLLEAAVPAFAALAAGLQGRAVADICPVYGVRTVALAPAPEPAFDAPPTAHLNHAHAAAATEHVGHVGQDDPAHDHHHATLAQSHDDHCVLAGMLSIAAPEPGHVLLPAQRSRQPGAAWWRCAAAVQDAAARWYSRLEHGPPAFA